MKYFFILKVLEKQLLASPFFKGGLRGLRFTSTSLLTGFLSGREAYQTYV